MLYAILCYNDEKITTAWSKAEDEAVMGRLQVVHDALEAKGKLGPTARLMPTTAATTLRKGDEPLIIDGPFVETKEQLLGFYVVDCATREAAVEAARDLRRANPTAVYEIRPILLYRPGLPFPITEAGSDGGEAPRG